MSQANVNSLLSAYEAFNRGDIETAFQAMTDDVEFVLMENSPQYRGSPYAGKHEVGEKLFAPAGADWDGYGIDVEKIHDAGETLIMQGRYRGRFKATGREAKTQVVHIWTLRDGKLSKLEQYVDTAGMRAVVGLA